MHHRFHVEFAVLRSSPLHCYAMRPVNKSSAQARWSDELHVPTCPTYQIWLSVGFHADKVPHGDAALG
jgi:hypothetical protein